MPSIINTEFHCNLASAFRKSIADNNVYMIIGQDTPWPNDSVPPTPKNNVEETLSVFRDALAAKRVQVTDVSLMAPRIDWVGGTVYAEYDSEDEDLFSKNFYILTDEMKVYKCIHNNNGAVSTVKPTSTITTVILTADGYRWKYLYTLQSADIAKFLTPEYMPVQVSTNELSDQFIAQQVTNAGGIVSIEVLNGGSGYTNATVTITGDGRDAIATATISAGVIQRITISDEGTAYSYANVTITGNGSGATARANVSPIGGHSSNAVNELGARYLSLAASFDGALEGIPTDVQFRKVSLVSGMRDSVGDGEFTGDITPMCYTLNHTGVTGSFVDGETVTIGASASGRVLQVGPNTILVSSIAGVIEPFGNIIGTSATSYYSSTISPMAIPYTGAVIYTENRQPIPRSLAQTEKITVLFKL